MPKPSADADTLKISSVPPVPLRTRSAAGQTAAARGTRLRNETLSVDLGPLDLEPVALDESQLAPLSADAETLPLPESLSLDDLLTTGPPAPAAAPRLEIPATETVGAEPVFELTDTEAPPLPMVEAGMGEPPALSVEEVLASPAAAAADVTIVDLPQIDLTTLSAALPPS